MSVAKDIVATYRGPRRVFARLLSGGPREDRSLMFLMLGCALVFVAQLPRLAREAHLTGQDLTMLMGASLLALLFIAPLILYVLAQATHLIARVIGGKGTAWRARVALFWALLAASPLVLLHGLVAGFIGPGAQLTLVGLIWCAVFFWFWASGLWVAERPGL